MKGFVVATPGYVRRYQSAGHGMRPAAQDPAHEHDQRFVEPGGRQCRSKDFHESEQCAKKFMRHILTTIEVSAMARLGTEKRPAVLRVQTEQRAHEVIAICQDAGIHYILGIESDEPEDIADIDRALNPEEPIRALPKVGRNDPCPCGSGLKFKKCCALTVPTS